MDSLLEIGQLYGLDIISFEKIDIGHINNTFKVSSGNINYILQRINPDVFTFADRIVHNETLLRNHLAKFNMEHFLVPIFKSPNGELFVQHGGAFWRLTSFIEGVHSPLFIANEKIAFNLGKKIAEFHNLTENAKVSAFKDVIPDFHNLSSRYKQYKIALDSINYKQPPFIEIILHQINDYKWLVKWFVELKKGKELKLRVCHNDTKISNTLVNNLTGEIEYLIDLDTVMPGYAFYDIGDAVRAGCSKSDESEIDSEKVIFESKLFHSILEGYFSLVSTRNKEFANELMIKGSMIMLYMQALRFMTDHILGNKYFHVKFEGQNAIRARNQLILLRQLNDYSKLLKI